MDLLTVTELVSSEYPYYQKHVATYKIQAYHQYAVCSCRAAASDKVYQLVAIAHGRWFSPGTSASSTTKTGCHDIAEILLKVALSTINQIKSNLLCLGIQDDRQSKTKWCKGH
jgi:hypothetical protein